ncbi:hypothetical protein O0Q50_22710 [Priestia aryabhattai]|uniref:Uncharacterized protein n=1 Tax=Priestia aryabhattai TaxID=412384 RepID=A0AAX6NDY6_PRIAR|nr:hypothetical protein [Priestia aryabhattai]MDU9693997.1 hypothetical protein [Priestia aryabhattai]
MTTINLCEKTLRNKETYTLKIVPTNKKEIEFNEISAVKFSISRALLSELEESGYSRILFTYDIVFHRLILTFTDNVEALSYVKTTQDGRKEYTTQASAAKVFAKLVDLAGVKARDKFSFEKEEDRFVYKFKQEKMKQPQEDLFIIDENQLPESELDNRGSEINLLPKIFKTYGVHFNKNGESKIIKVKIEHNKYTPEFEKKMVSDYVLNQYKVSCDFSIIDMGIEQLEEVILD